MCCRVKFIPKKFAHAQSYMCSHVYRMENDQLPIQLLYSQLKEGKRNQGRPRLGFKDDDYQKGSTTYSVDLHYTA